MKIVDIDRVVDQLLDRVFLPCRQVLAPLCDHGGEQVPARIVFLHPDRGARAIAAARESGANAVMTAAASVPSLYNSDCALHY